MRRHFLLLTLPLSLSSCLPTVTETTADPQSPSEERLKMESDRITRLETELHEMRLLFTNQIQRIEQLAAARSAQGPALSPPSQSQPQQVVIMPQTPVVTHRWQQEEAPATTSREPLSTTRDRSYRIQPGDTLSEIAERYHIPLARMLSANAGIDPRRIRPGQKIILPGAGPASDYSPSAATSSNYQVRPGDTLSEIASRYGVSLQNLLNSNPGIDPQRLRIGKRLAIPSPRTSRQAPQAVATGYTQSSTAYPDTNPQPRYQPARQPAPLPLPSTSAAAPEKRTPSKKVLVRIPYNKSLGEIAQECGTDVATLNRLNNSLLSAESRIKAETTIFVPVFEDSPAG